MGTARYPGQRDRPGVFPDPPVGISQRPRAGGMDTEPHGAGQDRAALRARWNHRVPGQRRVELHHRSAPARRRRMVHLLSWRGQIPQAPCPPLAHQHARNGKPAATPTARSDVGGNLVRQSDCRYRARDRYLAAGVHPGGPPRPVADGQGVAARRGCDRLDGPVLAGVRLVPGAAGCAGGRFGPNSFDFEGLSLPACTLFAFGAGVLAGVLLRRTLAAMAATIAGYLLVRVPMEMWLRPHLQAPAEVTTPAGAAAGVGRGDWVLSSGLTNVGGGRLSAQAESAVLHAAQTAGGPQENYLRSHGYGHWALIQPAGRFWHFQILEAATYTLLALACLVAAVLILRRHPR